MSSPRDLPEPRPGTPPGHELAKVIDKAETVRARERAVAAFGEEVAQSLARQAARSPREAALASLGRHASEEAVQAWIVRHRPGSIPPD